MNHVLADHLDFRNGKMLLDRVAAGRYEVFGSNGTIGRSNVGNADGPLIVIGRVGSYCGSLFYSTGPAWVSDNAIICTAKDRLRSRFWYYALRTLSLNRRSEGSGQPFLNQQILGSICYSPPPVREQIAIADVLGALDDKIAANTALATTADAWVRAVFEDVTFGAQETIGIGRLVTLVRDLVEPSLLPVDTVYVGMEHIPRRLMWLDSRGTSASITSTKSCFDAGDILFGKLRPYFHKVVSAPMGGVCSTDVLVVRPVDKKMSGFVLAAIASDEVVQRCTAASEGTRMPRTAWKDMAAIEVAWPGDAAACALSEKISRLRDVVEARLRESEMLTSMRDALLPQLMSGKIRVKDAEKTVSDCK